MQEDGNLHLLNFLHPNTYSSFTLFLSDVKSKVKLKLNI